MAKKTKAVVVPLEAKSGRYFRLPPVLDLFIVAAAQANGYRSPQEYVTELIRREYQKESTLAQAA